jgi:hypothetical protein
MLCWLSENALISLRFIATSSGHAVVLNLQLVRILECQFPLPSAKSLREVRQGLFDIPVEGR